MANGLTVESIGNKTVAPLREVGWTDEAIGDYLRGLGRSARRDSRWGFLPDDLRTQSREDARTYGRAASQLLQQR